MRPQVDPTCRCTFQLCIAFKQGPHNAWAGDTQIPEGGLLSGLERRINHQPEMLIHSSRTGRGAVTCQMEPRAHSIGISSKISVRYLTAARAPMPCRCLSSTPFGYALQSFQFLAASATLAENQPKIKGKSSFEHVFKCLFNVRFLFMNILKFKKHFTKKKRQKTMQESVFIGDKSHFSLTGRKAKE